MRLTLSETESILRKAARASGLPWGLAEEAGKAARWLAAIGLSGPETMYAHLCSLEGRDYADFVPDCSLQPWQAPRGPMCPVITGAALADRAAQMLDGKALRLGRTACPLLLAAMLGQAARYHDTAFVTCWEGVRVDCFGHGLKITGPRDKLLVAETAQVCCCEGDSAEAEIEASARAYEIDDEIFRRIDALAFRTYAPATEESRAGAGAGLTDND